MFKKFVKDVFLAVRAPVGLGARLRLLAGLVLTAAGGHRVVGFQVRSLSRTNLRLLYSEIFVRRTYAFSSDRPDPVILDCGANIGMATLFFKWLYPRARVTAFEPDPVTFAILEDNISRNGLRGVVVHKIALAGEETTIAFHVPAAGSLLMSAVASRSASAESIDVQAKRLSSFVDEDVDLLKLDVEGMEGPVLEDLASSGALARVREAIVEVHHNLPGAPTKLGDVLRLLDDAGFTCTVEDVFSPDASPGGYQDVVVRARRGP